MQHNPKFEQLCLLAQQQVKEVTIDNVKNMMDNNTLPLFIDVREDNEWQRDHLPQAIHIGRGVLERDIESKVTDFATPMILYCGGGYRSLLSAQSIKLMGYSQVYSLAGGYRGWKQAGFALVSD